MKTDAEFLRLGVKAEMENLSRRFDNLIRSVNKRNENNNLGAIEDEQFIQTLNDIKLEFEMTARYDRKLNPVDEIPF